jgi:hypothetical protein
MPFKLWARRIDDQPDAFPAHCVGELKGIGVDWFRLQFQ